MMIILNDIKIKEYDYQGEVTKIFITIEGTDGSGKTTQIELLSSYLKSLKKDIIVTREPGGTKISEKIRDLILDLNNTNLSNITEALLYAASRAQLVEEIIKPALKSNKIVLSDRFIDSSLVYQGIARGIGISKIEEINSFAVNGIKPNITFYLDIDPQIGINRKKKDTILDRIEMESLKFHQKVREGYMKVAAKYPERIYILNAAQSKQEIHSQICTILNNFCKEEF